MHYRKWLIPERLMRAAGRSLAALCENKSCFMCYRWTMTWERKWLKQSASFLRQTSAPFSYTSHTSKNQWTQECTSLTQGCKCINKHERQKKLDERTKGHDCNRTLIGLNQNHMCLHMSSYAAVLAWPFNSVTNLLFLWEPQTINHGVQSGGCSWKFSTSSLSNDCACIGVRAALLLGVILEHNFHRKWGWGHLFHTIVAKPQRAKQDQVYISPVVK